MIAWFVRNPVAANLLMVVMLVAGVFAFGQLSFQGRPNDPVDDAYIDISHSAKSAVDNERHLVLPIEDVIRRVPGIESVYSSAQKDRVWFHLRLDTRFPMDATLETLTEKLSGLSGFSPEVLRQLKIKRREYAEPTLSIAVSTALGMRDLESYVTWLRDGLRDGLRYGLPNTGGVSRLKVNGLQRPEIEIAVNQSVAMYYGITLAQIEKALEKVPEDVIRSVEWAAKNTLTQAGNAIAASVGVMPVLGRGVGALNELVIHKDEQGHYITLGDVAQLRMKAPEGGSLLRLNGLKAAMIQIERSAEGNALEMSREVAQFLKQYRTAADNHFTVTIIDNAARSLELRLGVLLQSIVIGAVILFLVMALFLQIKIAFWGVVGIFVAFSGALATMVVLDLSINAFSIFGFIVALGLVVDDAIVTGESIHYELRPRPGLDPVVATISGTQKIAGPVTFSMLTTIVAMLPLMFIDSSFQHYFYQIPIVVIPILVFSLVESKLILPHHLKTLRQGQCVKSGEGVNKTAAGVTDAQKPKTEKKHWLAAFKTHFTRWLDVVSNRYYPRALAWVLLYRYILLACAFGSFLVVMACFKSDWIPFGYFEDSVDADVHASLWVSSRLMRNADEQKMRMTQGEQMVERAALSLQADYRERYGVDVIEHVLTQTSVYGGGVTLKIAPWERYREFLSLAQIRADWHSLLPQMPKGVTARVEDHDAGDAALRRHFMHFSQSKQGHARVHITSASRETLKNVERALIEEVNRSSVLTLDDEGRRRFRPFSSQKTLDFTVSPFAIALGITEADIRRQLGDFLQSERDLSFDMGEEKIKGKLDWMAGVTRDPLDLVRFEYTDSAGQTLFLQDLIQGQGLRATERLKRYDFQATARVDLTYDSGAIPSSALYKLLKEKIEALAARFPTASLSAYGLDLELAGAVSSALAFTLMALLIIYILLAIPLGSYVQPLAILVTLPFCLMGALLGHAILGIEVGFMSLLGVVAALGVAVNDSLIFVHEFNYINGLRSPAQTDRFGQMLRLQNVLKRAGQARFKVVFLTSLSTVASLAPLILTQSAEGKLLVPMAASLGFGVLFASFLTLFMLPMLFMVAGDADRAFKSVRYRISRLSSIGDAGLPQQAGMGDVFEPTPQGAMEHKRALEPACHSDA